MNAYMRNRMMKHGVNEAKQDLSFNLPPFPPVWLRHAQNMLTLPLAFLHNILYCSFYQSKNLVDEIFRQVTTVGNLLF